MQSRDRDKLIEELRATIEYAERLKNETEEELKTILGSYYDEFVRTQQALLKKDNTNLSGSISIQN